MGVKIDLST